MNRYVWPLILFPLVLVGCSGGQQIGIDVELTLEFEGDISTFRVANPNYKTFEECEEKFGDMVPSFENNLPLGLPKGTKVTKWRCLPVGD